MAATLFKTVDYSVNKLIAEVESGEVGLPEIQRPFVWKKSKVRDLFDSMYRGFPVGYLLFWANAFAGKSRSIGNTTKQYETPRLLVVDGQQRLTSLFAVIKGVPVFDKEFREVRIQIAFRPKDQYFAVADATTQRDPEFIDDITELWAGRRGRNRFVKDFLRQLRESREVSEDEEDDLSESIDRLYDVQSYPFTALELASEVDEERVAEVFVRINSKGVTLNQADFILTLLSVFWEDGRKELEAFARAARVPSTSGPSPFNHFIEPGPDQMLRVSVGLAFRRGRLKSVYSILRGRDVDTDEYRPERLDEQFEQLRVAQAYALDLTHWHQFLECLVRAGFRSSSMISSKTAILYTYLLYLVGRRDFGVDPIRLREVMARWFFMAALTGRYSSSPESRIEQDLARLRGLEGPDAFIKALDAIVEATLTSDFWSITLPSQFYSSAAYAPVLFAYYASLNLLEARVLFSKMKVSELTDPALKPKKPKVERHHLFPKAYLSTLGITSVKEYNQIANMALVEWPDNIAISATPPSEYFAEFMKRLSPKEQEKAVFWHALPPGWEAMSYEAFLEARRVRLADVVRAGFERLKSGEVVEGDESAPRSIRDLIAAGESARVEFKASARYNLHTAARDERVEHAIVKTIAGFLNSATGGTLLIGVDDDGAAVGLDNDYGLLKKKDRDGFELWLMDTLLRQLGKPSTVGVNVSFDDVDGHDVCRVDVVPASAPVFLRPSKGAKQAEFWLRFGNSTRQLETADVLEYQKTRWLS
jgi:hypothetical protein